MRDMLSDLEELEKALRDKPAMRKWALLGGDIGSVGLDCVFTRLGPGEIYIPGALSLKKMKRNKEIFNDFTGNNYSELAREYLTSVSTVRRIVEREKERR